MRLLPLIILVGSLLLSGCSDDEDFYAPDPLVDIDNQFKSHVVWSTSVGSGQDDLSVKIPPVYAYGKIYAVDAFGVVAAIDPKNGRKIWSKDFDLPIAGGPAVANKILAFGTSQGEVYALNAETGEKLWQAQVSSEIISTPAVGDGYVVVRTTDGKIFAFDGSSGEQKWFYDESIPSLTLRGNSSPVIFGGGVMAGFSNGKLAVFILENGQLAWEKRIATAIGGSEIQRLVDIDLQPQVVGSSIYIGSFNGNLASLNYRNGEFNWQRELSTYRDLAVGDLLLFATHENSYVSAVNRSNGVIIWTQKDLHRRQLTAPAVVDGYVVVADFEGYLHWISQKTGKIVSRTSIDSSGFSSRPLVIDNTLILYSKDGSLYAIKK